MYPRCESASIALNSFLPSVREANLALICEVVCLDPMGLLSFEDLLARKPKTNATPKLTLESCHVLALP